MKKVSIAKSFVIKTPSNYSPETIIETMVSSFQENHVNTATVIEGPFVYKETSGRRYTWDDGLVRQKNFPNETNPLLPNTEYQIDYLKISESSDFSYDDIVDYLKREQYYLVGAQTLALLWVVSRSELPVYQPWLIAVDVSENRYKVEDTGNLFPAIVIGNRNEDCLGTWKENVGVTYNDIYILGVKKSK